MDADYVAFEKLYANWCIFTFSTRYIEILKLIMLLLREMAIMDFFSPEIIGAIMIGCMLFAIFVGFPISFTLIFLGLFLDIGVLVN